MYLKITDVEKAHDFAFHKQEILRIHLKERIDVSSCLQMLMFSLQERKLLK